MAIARQHIWKIDSRAAIRVTRTGGSAEKSPTCLGYDCRGGLRRTSDFVIGLGGNLARDLVQVSFFESGATYELYLVVDTLPLSRGLAHHRSCYARPPRCPSLQCLACPGS